MRPKREQRRPAVEHEPAPLRRLGRLLLIATVMPLAAALLLHRLDVPLGCPGRFVYPYTPVFYDRLSSALAAIVLALPLGLGVGLLAARSPWYRRFGLLVIVFASLTLGLWSYVAPPAYQQQLVFNTYSPSQDGAFVIEAGGVASVRDYLRAFPDRARTPPAEMSGTRVISNPPATTLLAVAIARALDARPAWRNAVVAPLGPDLLPELRDATAVGLVFFWVLTGLWLLAGVFLYATARLFLPPATAALYALCGVFSPATFLLTPGKDTAQLLAVAIPLYLWLLACQRHRMWAAVLAGGVFVLTCLVSLVHVWIAAIIVVATLLTTRKVTGGWRRVFLHALLPATAGALVTAGALYVTCGVNLPAIANAVAQAQAAVTRGPDAMPLHWQVLGVPLFLLFAGPACWAIGLWLSGLDRSERARDDDARLGFWLLIGCVAVMLATVGFTNIETPRLWMPFAPLLLLGGLLQFGFARQPSRRIAVVFAALAAVQIAVSAVQWTLMDMRETESRLVEQRFFG